MSSAKDYKKLSQREHILTLPDTYIGSIETNQEGRWVYNEEEKHMTWKKIMMNPGLYKIFDEILVNARDAFIRSTTEKGRTPIKRIDITIERESSKKATIRVENDGDGIPVEEHPTEKMWVPEMIFGHLLTSSNYNQNEEKIVGGKNGIGSKASNIFSKRFTVETVDVKEGKRYTQTWTDNMSKCEKPTIKKTSSKTGMVAIEFEPDLARFPGGLSEDMLLVLHTRSIELAAMVGNTVKVSWNGHVISTNTFEKFTKLFLKEGSTTIAYENAGPRWEVAAVLTRQLYTDEDEGLPNETNISFVNGINTRKGGKHVDMVIRHILGEFCEMALKKKKLDLKPGQIKDSVVFFVNATIVNPAFDSQSKEYLTTPVAKFGSQPKWSGKLVEGLMKLGLMDEAQAVFDAKAAREAKKTDGKKRSTLHGLPKLTDALWAGTAKSDECTLILTEGDSAASSAIAGISVVGRERWGVFPLKGKMLNVRDVSITKINSNDEIVAIKRILGLEHGKKYTDTKSLRYGHIMIMADQDHDGSHIKGLVMNLIHAEWPSLIKCGFICSLMTPIVKASKGKQVEAFYSLAAFEEWKEKNGGGRGWSTKYYKGLGSSSHAEAKEWFKKLNDVKYEWTKDTDNHITLAFSKKRAEDRKDWLAKYDPKVQLDFSSGHCAYEEFINKELIHFSNADNIRSIPSLIDGLKPSQRKILYGCIKRNLRSEIKVAQLAGYVSEHTSYHHGEASLNSTIVGMAQNFVGSNNLNLLKPCGQFGTRIQGGDDAASPRYIHTYLNRIVDTLFRKEDAAILNHLDDDGMKIEPEYFMPILPYLAINGAIGIGTGFSTDIPPHNPEHVIALQRARLSGKITSLTGRELDPWWFGFKGKVTRADTNTWVTHGTYVFDDKKKTIRITELPVGTWTQKYKEFLDKICSSDEENMGLKNFEEMGSHVKVDVLLYLTDDMYDEYETDNMMFEKNFKLQTTYKKTNMCCFDDKNAIKKYETIGDMMEGFYEPRMKGYEERKRLRLEAIEKELVELSAKVLFIRAFLDGRLKLAKETDENIVKQLKGLKIPALSDPTMVDDVKGYDYLLRMRIDRIKESAIKELEKDMNDKTDERDLLVSTTTTQMWLKEIDEFEEAWNDYVVERLEENELSDEVVVKKTKKTSKK
jgi:DNA topoisomerase-2